MKKKPEAVSDQDLIHLEPTSEVASIRQAQRQATSLNTAGLRQPETGLRQRLLRQYYRLRPDLRRAPRHIRALVKYGTPRRWLNVATVEAERKLGRTVMRGKPYIIFVDPINVCNLRCPLCPTGNNTLKRQQGKMSLEHYEHVIDEVAPWALEVSLYNWGEPLLHPQIFEMVRYAHDKRLATNMSSNFNRVSPSDIDGLINSGLDHLCLSIDGATQESYATYRVKGDLELVLENTRALVRRRRELGKHYPVIEWQFIVMKHNEHEMEQARQLSKEVGADLIRFIPVGLPFNAPNKQELAKQWYGSDPNYRYWDPDAPDFFDQAIQKPGGCYYLYRSMTVNPGGGVAPCCIVDNEKMDFGNLTNETLDEMWNNEQYQSARAEFSSHAPSNGVATVCTGCKIFEKPERPTNARESRSRPRGKTGAS